ncbi:MAG: ABC transporter permease [Candidatus Acididesulfobacter diazotrophicus]|jgi:peptide/nickel transport system permease protein|uniref:ABC transporter permease n=1 Tax=Candidatus Acididesulfobacter diazotrophicus TaxID=2597226 RepID=A0A519BN50_9DELT|nr:MAG: ABC transporter permease [Candidatus Acididesulfobacter diazotrophicus]
MKELINAFKKNKLALFSLLFILLIIAAAIFAPFIVPYNPDKINVNAILLPPSFSHWLGTDQLGRDVFSRLIYGSRISIEVGFIAVSISLFIGVIIGAFSGYYSGLIDSLLMRFVDIMLTFPSFFLILAISAILKPSIINIMIIIGLTSWMGVARIVRAEFIQNRQKDYVLAAKASGASDSYIIFSEILPNCIAPILVSATLGIAGAILIQASLAFLGIGIMPPTPSWGGMLSRGKTYIMIAWWLTLFPGIAILMTVLSFNLMGEAVRDALDPRINNSLK